MFALFTQYSISISTQFSTRTKVIASRRRLDLKAVAQQRANFLRAVGVCLRANVAILFPGGFWEHFILHQSVRHSLSEQI